MSGASTIAARCASLSTAISQIIADTTSFSRRLRDTRHDINAINADLLAIKLSLDIARDDFAAVNANAPVLLVEATSGLLDCCSSATQSLHKPIIRLSTSDKRSEIWRIFKKRDLENHRQDIEALRCALDLVLDIVVLFSDANDEPDTESPTRIPHVHFLDGEHSLLKRIDVEREHIDSLIEGRLPVLCSSFERLRACATFVLEDQHHLQQPDHPEQRSISRQNYLDSPRVEDAQSGGDSPAPPASPVSTSNGIGAWIANVLSQKVHLPMTSPSIATVSDSAPNPAPVDRQELAPSRGTFYAESVTSGTRTHSSGKRLSIFTGGNVHPRVDSPQETVKASKMQQTTYYATSTIVSSEDASSDHRITSDQLSLAIAKRKRLTRKQKLSKDQDLRSIARTTSADVVEQLLWEGANPNVPDDEFGFLHIRAAFELSTEILQLLAEYGADITKTMTTTYHSAIHAAVLGKRLDNLRYLIDLGMSVDTPNADGETPLHLAVKTPGAYQIAKLLLDSGADVNRDANEEGTPFHVVMNATRLDSRERTMLVELLLAHGAEGDFSVETTERRGKGLSVLGLI